MLSQTKTLDNSTSAAAAAYFLNRPSDSHGMISHDGTGQPASSSSQAPNNAMSAAVYFLNRPSGSSPSQAPNNAMSAAATAYYLNRPSGIESTPDSRNLLGEN